MKIRPGRIFLVLVFCFVTITACPSLQPVDIYLIGDSITATKPANEYPRTGWGQMLPELFTQNVTIHNHAKNGRSTKSFIDQGRWETVRDSLKPGDWVFIQFGHNDEKAYDTTRYTDPHTTFQANLKMFIRETREQDAIPVLLTPVVRRKFDESGALVETHGEYPDAVRQVAEDTGVLFIDMQKKTHNLVSDLGPERSKKIYLHLNPGDSGNWPEGLVDNSHLSEYGAAKVCSLLVDGIKAQNIKLQKYVSKRSIASE